MSFNNTKISVTPKSCLQDEPVDIKVEGLKANDDITVSAIIIDSKGVVFYSHSHFNANSEGKVDANIMESKGGSYTGIFPMGLLSSFVSAPHEKKYTRLFKRDVEIPSKILLQVHNGHLTAENLLNKKVYETIASTYHYRHYMAPGVEKVKITQNGVRGNLFIPAGEGPFPGVIDMFGSAGGLLDFRAAQLASRGIAALALPFFAYEDLPTNFETLDITYFDNAVKVLLSHEKVLKPWVGSIGVSKGGDLSLSMGTFIPEVKVAISINGCVSSVSGNFKVKDRTFSALHGNQTRYKLINNEIVDCYDIMNDPKDYPDTIIPIEEADTNFLFIVGDLDRNWKSKRYAKYAVERLEKAGKSNYKVSLYAGAGHLIEPPYSTFCESSYHKIIGYPVLWGGELKSHVEAQINCWNEMIRFIKDNLKENKSKL